MMSARTVADKLFNNFMLRFGFPNRVLHDQRKEFDNKLFHQLQQFCGMIRSRTTTYDPQFNTKAERFNQVLLAILRILPEERKKYIPKIENTYNTTAVDANQQVTPPVPILHFLGAITSFAN